MMKNIGLLLFLSYSTFLFGNSKQDGVIVPGKVNIATLVINLQDSVFEGGNVSYYNAEGCTNDSLPFLIDYIEPGDFGSLAFKLIPSNDTIFYASIWWMAVGQIMQPDTFNLEFPFVDQDVKINKPDDFKLFHIHDNLFGNYFGDDEEYINQANVVWDLIDDLEVTKAFADYDYKAGIYFYTPSVGMFDPSFAKWVVFLYYADNTTSIPAEQFNVNTPEISLYPNPVNDNLNITSLNADSGINKCQIYSASGEIVLQCELNEGKQMLNVAHLPSGVYFVSVSNELGSVFPIQKLIKY